MDVTGAARSEFTLRLRHRFAAPREKVFAAWTRPEALKRWWCPPGWYPLDVETDLQEGGLYRFSMQRESGTQVITAYGRFLTVVVPLRLVYTWNWEGAFLDMPEARVTVDFHATAGGTEIELRQEDLSMRVCARHLSGWMNAFDRLSACVGYRSGRGAGADVTSLDGTLSANCQDMEMPQPEDPDRDGLRKASTH